MRSPKCIPPSPESKQKDHRTEKWMLQFPGLLGLPLVNTPILLHWGAAKIAHEGRGQGHMGVGRGRDKIPTPSARRGGEDPQPHPVPRDSEGCRTEQRLRGRVIHIYVHSLYFSRCATLTHRGISITQSSKKIIKHLLTKQQHPRY